MCEDLCLAKLLVRDVCQWSASIYESAFTRIVREGGPKLTLR